MTTITRIKVKNLFGIEELELNGDSVEIIGAKGKGKTSVLDALRYAFTNSSNREFIVRQGNSEGEILVETNDDLTILRKKRENRGDYKSIKLGQQEIKSPERYLSQIITPLQLNPVEFSRMTTAEQNRAILDLIDFKWDMNWISEKFGEIPKGVNYDQNILKVLHDIQKEDSQYFLERQDINREIKHKKAFIEDIAAEIPEGYQYERWNSYDLAGAYKQLNDKNRENEQIINARKFQEDIKERESSINSLKLVELNKLASEINSEKFALEEKIDRLKESIENCRLEISNLDDKYNDKAKVIEVKHEKNLELLRNEHGRASEYARRTPHDVEELESGIATAEEMKKHLREYVKMNNLRKEIEDLKMLSAELTSKIETARRLPSEILENTELPIPNLTIEDGKPLINGLPLSNLSTGETIEMCVNVAIAKSGNVKIVLLDGMESLQDDRLKLYDLCRKNGIQFIATRTTNDNELEIINLGGTDDE